MHDSKSIHSAAKEDYLLPELHAMTRILARRIWVIVTCVVAGVILAIAYLHWTRALYQAQSVVEVEQEDAKVVKAEPLVSTDMRSLDTMNTVAQKLSNPAPLEEVLSANNLLPAGSGTDEFVSAYEGRIKVALRRNTRLIDVTVKDGDPQIAAKIANGLVAVYLRHDAEKQMEANAKANDLLQRQAGLLKVNLEASEQALEDYRKQAGAISLLQSQDILTPQLQDLSRRLTEAKAGFIEADGAFQDSLKMSSDVDKLLAFPEVASDPDIVQTAAELTKSRNEFVLICQRYRAKHPKYILAQSSVTALETQLETTALTVRTRDQESLRIARQKALTARNGLQQALDESESKALQLSESAVHFNVLSRQVESDRALYDSTISRLGETTLAAQITPERIRVVQPATAPSAPIWPKPILVWLVALLGGLGMGLGASLMLEAMQRDFRSPEELEQFLEMPVLGVIHKLPGARGSKNVLIAAENCNPAANEIFRTLRTSLSMLGREKNRQTFLITSSTLSEGKTFTAINFAVSLAQQGLRTLLIDADLRRPMIAESMTGKKEFLSGLSDYLQGGKKLNEICRAHEKIPNLFWISSGSQVANSSELLAQKDLQPLLNDALTHYDRVVIDTAPLLPVSDTLWLVAKAQTVVLVVQGSKTSRQGVERSVRLLHSANARIAGVILNSGYKFSYYNGDGHAGNGHATPTRTDSGAPVIRA